MLSPATGMHASPEDMMTFLKANISLDKKYVNHLLDYTHNARLKLDKTKSAGSEIAAGWKIDPVAGEKRVIWHNGITNGYASFIGFVESSHIGVFVLSATGKDVTPLGMALIEKLNRN